MWKSFRTIYDDDVAQEDLPPFMFIFPPGPLLMVSPGEPVVVTTVALTGADATFTGAVVEPGTVTTVMVR